MAIEDTIQHKIFFYRKGNGGAYVHRSPETVRFKENIRFWNITGCKAKVMFTDKDIVDKNYFEIDPGAYADVQVELDLTGKKPEYHRYHVDLVCTRSLATEESQYAEGGSDAGLIVDP